jgi:hypothetical protein
MQTHHAIRLMRDVCALRHLSINTEKTYTHWLGQFGLFLKHSKLKATTPELKMEVSTQNEVLQRPQAFQPINQVLRQIEIVVTFSGWQANTRVGAVMNSGRRPKSQADGAF